MAPVGKQTIVEVALLPRRESSGAGELIKALLLKAGLAKTELSEKLVGGKTAVCVYVDQRRARLLERQIRSSGVKNLIVEFREFKPSDWQDKWKDSFRPVILTSDLKVFPVWWEGKVALKKGQHPVWIITDLSFGTGMHETTRFTAQLIERCAGKFKAFLDIGTGTGILAVVANHYGAQQIDAVDDDADCVKTAKQNIKLNHIAGTRVKVADAAKLPFRKPFDFVAANLNSYDLIKLKRSLLKQVVRGGYLALSGISLENLYRLKQEFKPLPVRCVKILHGRKWAAVLYRKD